MAKQIANVDILTDTFNGLILRTNEVIEAVRSEVMTANSTAGVTGSPAAPRNSRLHGTFQANTFVANNLTVDTFTANSTAVRVATAAAFIANGSSGSPGQLLTTDGSRIYWSTAAGTGTVTQLANGAGIIFTDLPGQAFGSPITSYGTIRIRAGDGIVVDSRGVSVNTSFLQSLNTNATTLQNRQWQSPGEIGVATANTGTFTTVTAGLTSGYRLASDTYFLINNSVIRTQGTLDVTTPNSGSSGGVRVRANQTTGIGYIQITDYLGSTEYGHFKTHANGFIVWSGSMHAGGGFPNLIPAGTVMLFAQTNAPTGWTKITTHDNKALRVVSGAASSGGTTGFTAAFNTALSTDGTTLTIDQMPSHYHYDGAGGSSADLRASMFGVTSPSNIGGFASGSISSDNDDSVYAFQGSSEGGGASHSHTIPNFDVAYVDVILASKN